MPNGCCEQKFRLKEPAVAQASCKTVEACPAHSLIVKSLPLLALKNIAIKGLPQVHPQVSAGQEINGLAISNQEISVQDIKLRSVQVNSQGFHDFR